MQAAVVRILAAAFAKALASLGFDWNIPLFVLNADNLWHDFDQHPCHTLAQAWRDSMSVLLLTADRQTAQHLQESASFSRNDDGQLTYHPADTPQPADPWYYASMSFGEPDGLARLSDCALWPVQGFLAA
jgi:hypothetical protein